MNPNEEHVCFYYELGMAISQWAHVEIALGQLVTVCCKDPSERMALYVGLFSLDNFRAKLQFVDSMLRERFKGHSLLEEWPRLHSRLDANSKKRNKLAHRMVCAYPTTNTAGRRIALIPWPKASLLRAPKERRVAGRPPTGALCLKDVNQFKNEFVALYVQIMNFAGRLQGSTAGMFPAFAEIGARPQTLPALRNHIHAALGPKPSPRKS
jgi:hypothetical protein